MPGGDGTGSSIGWIMAVVVILVIGCAIAGAIYLKKNKASKGDQNGDQTRGMVAVFNNTAYDQGAVR